MRVKVLGSGGRQRSPLDVPAVPVVFLSRQKKSVPLQSVGQEDSLPKGDGKEAHAEGGVLHIEVNSASHESLFFLRGDINISSAIY